MHHGSRRRSRSTNSTWISWRPLISLLAVATLVLGLPGPATGQIDDVEDALEQSENEPKPTPGEATEPITSEDPSKDAPAIDDEDVPDVEIPQMATLSGTSPRRTDEPRRELPSLRTRTSRTFALHDGNREAELFASSIHFRQDDGWVPIDNSLIASEREGYAYENAANRYKALLPQSLSGAPVRFEFADGWISMKLKDAAGGDAEVSGATALYRDVLDGVDARYGAAADVLKEELILKGAPATNTFVFSVATSDGLELRQGPSGGIEIVESDGTSEIAMLPPTMFDSSPQQTIKPLSLDLRTTDTGLEIALVADPTWLADPERVFPVYVDPSFAFQDALRDCWIHENNPNSNYCGGNKIRAGYNGSDRVRTLIKFNTSTDIPEKSKVLNGELALYVETTTDGNQVGISSHRITNQWNSNVTWNDYDGTNAWPDAGGSHDKNNFVFNNDAVGVAEEKWEYWLPASLVDRWVDGRRVNRGLLLKTDRSTTNVVFFVSSQNANRPDVQPRLTVEYFPWLGEESYYKLETRQLNDRMHAHANVANGDLMVHNTDLNIKGTGLDLEVERHYNSMMPTNDQNEIERGAFGPGWVMGTGADVRLKEYPWLEGEPDGHVGFFGPSGFHIRFDKQQSGGYDPAPGINAELTRDSTRTHQFHVEFDDDRSKLKFDSNGVLQVHQDKNGNKIKFAYNSDGTLASIRDTRNRTVTFTYDTEGRVIEMNDNVATAASPDGRSYVYTYNTEGRLATYQDPVNANPYVYEYYLVDTDATTYGDGLLKKVTDPKQNETTFTYDSEDRLDRVTRVTSSTSDVDPATDFNYQNGTTDVADPDNNTVTYDHDNIGRITKVTDQNNDAVASSYTANAEVEKLSDYGDISQSPFEFSYNNRNLTEVTLPTTGIARNKYKDTNNNPHFPTAVGDFRDKATKYRWDADGNLTATRYDCELNSGCNHAISFSYTSKTQGTTGITHKGLLDRIDPPPQADATDPGNDTILTYTDRGELEKIDPPGTHGTYTFEYDDLSRITKVTDGKGTQIDYTWDPLDRLDRIDYTSADGTSTSSIDYTYDPNGNLEVRQEPTKTTTWTYDDLNRITHKDVTDGGGAPIGEPMDFNYYVDGTLASITYNPGTTDEAKVSYEYDPANQITALVDPNGNRTTFEHNQRHLRNATHYPNGVTLRTYWDDSRRPTRIEGIDDSTGTFLDEFDYDYVNGSGVDTGMIQSETGRNDYVESYVYDKVSRLTKAETTKPDGTVTKRYTYDYDKHGNVTQRDEEISGSPENLSYNKANELTDKDGRTFNHDANGNLASSGDDAWVISYTLRDQTEQMKSPDGQTGAMGYVDADSTERVARGAITYTHDLLGLAVETDSSGNTTRYLRDDKGGLVETIGADGSPSFYLSDALGSITGLADMSGNLTANYTYTPFGRSLKGGSDWAPYNPWRFAGGYLDRPTDVYKFGTRFYAPDLLRWTQRDPKMDQQRDPMHGQNLYAYANLNPINAVDPSGKVHESFECRMFTVVGAVSLAIAVAGAAVAARVPPLAPPAIITTLATAALSIISFVGAERAGCYDAH